MLGLNDTCYGVHFRASLLYNLSTDMKDAILSQIVQHYLNSSDFNGFPIRDFTLNMDALKNILILLIEEDKISLNFGDVHPNPYIKAFREHPKEKQIELLQSLEDLIHVCAYPSPAHLKGIIEQSRFQDRPFTLRLALGEPQLAPEYFDLSVLEFYRNDPRYYYENDDIQGNISIKDEYFESQAMPESDQVLLQTFGFAYDPSFNRAVTTYIRYLADLSPQHQQIWNAKIVKGDYKIHPDYWRITVGDWDLGSSVFNAFTQELEHINEMSKLIGRPSLFKSDFQESKPREFCFLIRPTLKEFNDFVHLLDKMISENINRDFFQKDVEFEVDEVRKDGKIVVRQKGTIQILDEWLAQKYRVQDRTPIEEMLGVFRKIRRLRQHPAHAVDENVFDQKYFKEQRELITKAYEGIRTIRLLLTNHPNVKGYEIPDWLQSGTIWTY